MSLQSLNHFCILYKLVSMKIILEIIGWLTITLGVTLACSLIAFAVYLKWNGDSGKLIAIIIISVGFITGAIWASYIWKKTGTMQWLGGIRRIT